MLSAGKYYTHPGFVDVCILVRGIKENFKDTYDVLVVNKSKTTYICHDFITIQNYSGWEEVV